MTAPGIIAPHDHWLFAGISPEQVQPVLDAGHEARYLPGDVIFREGDPADGLYLITAGSLRVTATGASGETFLAVVKANEVLGEMGVLDGQARSATATALSMCAAYFLPTEAFLDLLEGSTAVCLRLLAILTLRLRVANGRLGELPPTGAVGTEDSALEP